MTSGSNLSEAFVRQFERKKVRDLFVAEMLSSRLSKMVRTLRTDRGWTQKQLAKKLGTTQSAISRIESAEYGKVNVSTLLALAAEFDLPLFIDMPEWRDWFSHMRDMSKASFERKGFDVAALTRGSPEEVKFSKATASSTPPKIYHGGDAMFGIKLQTNANADFYVIGAESRGRAA